MARSPQEIAANIGSFSVYEGKDGSKVHENGAQGYLALQMLSQLDPQPDYATSRTTSLQTPIHEQEGTVTISAKGTSVEGPFGANEVTVSKSTLNDLVESARITTSERVPTGLYLAMQNELIDQITVQDQRPLAQILTELGTLDDWKSRREEFGFATDAEFAETLNTPLLVLSSNVCHSEEVHFFVEQHLNADGKACNQTRSGNLDEAVPNILVSVPGINYDYGVLDSTKPEDIETGRQHMGAMWDVVLAAAVSHGARNIAIPPIGLGAFAGENPKPVAYHYFSELFQLLNTERYAGKFDNIYYNPLFFGDEFVQAQAEYKPQNIVRFGGDVKFLAVELAKEGHSCALVNPSDADVMWGKQDVGQYYKNGDYVGEEDIAATSTSALGSREIADCYVNPAKVQSADARLAQTKAASMTRYAQQSSSQESQR